MRRLFLTAFFQVALVSANTFFVAQLAWVGIAVASFGISYLWTLNVKRISVGSMSDRLAYSTGAMLGGLTGVLASKYVYGLINQLIS